MRAKKTMAIRLLFISAAVLLNGNRGYAHEDIQHYHNYEEVIQKTQNMVSDSEVVELVNKYGLTILDLTWEDTGRYKNSAIGPNISDMTIQVQQKKPGERLFSLACMPVIRFQNFSDKTGDIPLDKFPIRVTVQFYKATSNGAVSDKDIKEIAEQINKVYDNADYVGSLVIGDSTGRPTEYIGDKIQPPDWWEQFWKRHQQNMGQTKEDEWRHPCPRWGIIPK